MRVYRGPNTRPFQDDSHEFVSSITAETLEKSIRDGSYITFDISKNATERKSVCTTRFEDGDIVPMISGLLARLRLQQDALFGIRDVAQDTGLNSDQKMKKINELLRKK